MTRGWGEIARVCRARGALTIHLEFDGAFVMLFKVFDEEGRRLRGGRWVGVGKARLGQKCHMGGV